MHDRSVFKVRPLNYEELARKHANFRAKCFIGAGGKICVNFADPEAVRLLTILILLEYFELDVHIPVGSLVPRVPQRLDYILLLEDLIAKNKLDVDKPVWGIDIGTGTSCIYPLLGASLNRWNFVASEVDVESIRSAEENIKRNNMEEQIQIFRTTDGTILKEVFLAEAYNDMNFTFTLCNPPFYDVDEATLKFSRTNDGKSLKNLYGTQDKKAIRSAPRSATTANSGEIMYMGGEASFVELMMRESIEIGRRTSFYTTLLGKLASIRPLKSFLKENGIRHAVHSLSQGRTTRWVLIWTFCEEIDIK